ncbi:MAG: SIMPL domain-containing protein [Phycisphaerales bacterium]
MSGNKTASFLLGATLALGFALSAYMVSTAMIRMRQDNTIKVKGYSEKQIKADTGSWTGEMAIHSAQLSAAYRDMDANRVKVRELIDKIGFNKETKIDFQPVSFSTQYKLNEKGNSTNEIYEYVLNQTVKIESNQIELIEAVSKNASDLIREGIEFRSYQPVYTYSGIEKIKIELLAEATKNAYERARTLAENSGGKAGKLCSASQGVFQITPLNSTDVSDMGEYNTSTIDKKVKAVVTLEFNVEK